MLFRNHQGVIENIKRHAFTTDKEYYHYIAQVKQKISVAHLSLNMFSSAK